VGLTEGSSSGCAATLSGGESQRIRLSTQISSELMGMLYVLDEPSIGLHQRDNELLIKSLKNLRDIGNTVIVVEHDKQMMEEADFVVDLGPGAGTRGGRVVAAGTAKELERSPDSVTGRLLARPLQHPIGERRAVSTRGPALVIKERFIIVKSGGEIRTMGETPPGLMVTSVAFRIKGK